MRTSPRVQVLALLLCLVLSMVPASTRANALCAALLESEITGATSGVHRIDRSLPNRLRVAARGSPISAEVGQLATALEQFYQTPSTVRLEIVRERLRTLQKAWPVCFQNADPTRVPPLELAFERPETTRDLPSGSEMQGVRLPVNLTILLLIGGAIGGVLALLVYIYIQWMRRKKRLNKRYRTKIPVQVVTLETVFSGFIVDISMGGAKLRVLESSLNKRDRVDIVAGDFEAAAKVVWCNRWYAGLVFLHPLTEAELSAARSF